MPSVPYKKKGLTMAKGGANNSSSRPGLGNASAYHQEPSLQYLSGSRGMVDLVHSPQFL